MIRAALSTDQQIASENLGEVSGKDEFLENRHEANQSHDRLVVDHAENDVSNLATKLPDIHQPNTSRSVVVKLYLYSTCI